MYIHVKDGENELLVEVGGNTSLVFRLAIQMQHDEETGDWVAEESKFRRAGQGKTPEAALKSLKQVILAYVSNLLQREKAEEVFQDWPNMSQIDEKVAVKKIQAWFAGDDETHICIPMRVAVPS